MRLACPTEPARLAPPLAGGASPRKPGADSLAVYIDRQIGKGGAGKVYSVAGEGLFLTNSYALKVPLGTGSGFEREKRFLRRVQRGARENHVVQVVRENVAVFAGGFLRWTERPELSRNNVVMELALGSLKTLIRPMQLEPSQRLELLLRVAPQALEAVRFCHARNVAHLDVKADNFLCFDMRAEAVALADFSVAWGGPDDGEFRRVRGTAPYIAPEQHVWLDDPHGDDYRADGGWGLPWSQGALSLSDAKRMDWYSVGFFFFEILCCGLRFVNPAILRSQLEKCTEDAPLRSAVDELIMGLLRAQPAERLDPDIEATWERLKKSLGRWMRFEQGSVSSAGS